MNLSPENIPVDRAVLVSLIALILSEKALIPLLTNNPLLPSPFIDETAHNPFFHNVQQLDQVGQKLWQRLYQVAQC